MAYQEFYVTQGSLANKANGGYPNTAANDGPVVTRLVTVAADGLTITATDTANWTGAAIGDWVCVNDGTNYGLAKMTNIVGAAATVSPALPAALRSDIGDTAKVGGAWPDLGTAEALLDVIGATNWPASTDWPRVNVKIHGGNAYTTSNGGTWSASITWGTAWDTTATDKNLTIEGYVASPGDTSWRTSANRAVLSCSISGSPAIHVNQTGIRWLNIKAINSSIGASSHAWTLGSGVLTATGGHWNCEAYAVNGSGFHTTNATTHVGARLIRCFAHDCGVNGFTVPKQAQVLGCQSYTNAGKGFSFLEGGTLLDSLGYNNTGITVEYNISSAANGGVIRGNTLDGNGSAEGIYLKNGASGNGQLLALITIDANFITNFTTGLTANDTQNTLTTMYTRNVFYGNSTANVLASHFWDGGGNVTGINPGYTNRTTRNYTPLPNSPGILRSGSTFLGYVGSQAPTLSGVSDNSAPSVPRRPGSL